MAQTEKAWAVIEALLADNTSGDISPQDLRDALASAMGYGGISLSTGAAGATQAGVSGTPAVVDVFDTKIESVDVNTAGVAADIVSTYSLTPGSTGIYMVSFWSSFSSSSVSRTVTFQMFRDGALDEINIDRYISASDTGVVAASCITSITAGEVLDMRASVSTATTTLTYEGLAFNVHRVG